MTSGPQAARLIGASRLAPSRQRWRWVGKAGKPSRPEPKRRRPDPRRPRDASSRLRVLLLEDNPGDAELTASLLSDSLGHEVHVEHTETLEAAELLSNRTFDVILLDIHLPDGSGVAALRRVRAIFPKTPTIAITGLGDEFMARACLEAGAADYVEKGDLDTRTVFRVVEYALSRARAPREQGGEGGELEDVDRFAKLGRLAARVAHEVNNPAAFVRPNTVELSRQLALVQEAIDREGERGGDQEDGDLGQRLAPVLAKMRTMLEDNLYGIDRIIRVVEDLGSLARADDELRARLVNVPALCRASSQLLTHRLRYRSARLVLELEDTRPVLADPQRLGQVVTNLLLNAVRATSQVPDRQGRVTLRTRPGKNDSVVVSIEDNGGGIPAADLERVFTPFYTTETASGGTGLGLAVSLEIVEKLGGVIEVESTPGHGARFDVILPAASGDVVGETTPSAHPRVAPVQRRILIIDDEELIRLAFGKVLGRHHRVELASRGEEALSRLESGEVFDVIICDLVMPGLGGPDTIQRIQAEFPSHADRIVVCSGGPSDPATAALIEALGLRVLTKPASVRKVLEIVEDVCG